MSEMQAFERQLERRIHRFVGPARPVDDLAVFEAVASASRPRTRGFTMFSALKLMAASAIVALFGGFLLAGVLTAPADDEVLPAAVTASPTPATTEEPAFPTGTFVSDDGDLTLEFRADGTCERAGVPCVYGVHEDAYTEMAFEDPAGEQVPVTYLWDFDDERLTFERWGEDRRPDREEVYLGHAFVAAGETLPLPPKATDFPTGTFVSLENPDKVLEFSKDGTGRSYKPGRSEARFSYGVTGDLFAEMTSEFLSGDPKVPATYHWARDGEQLAFEVWGEDLGSSRSFTFGENTWVPVGDPQAVVIAVSDIEAGDTIFGRMVQLGVVYEAEVGADFLTDRDDVAGSIAAVPISKGQPITPGMLDEVVPTGQ